MSLNWDISKVQNHETVCYNEDGSLKQVTESLIWSMMSIDQSGVTEKNLNEVLFRIRMVESAFGPFRFKVGKDDKLEGIEFSLDELKAHVGLKCNVGETSRAKFLRDFSKRMEGAVERKIRIEMERLQEQTEKEVK